MPRKIIQIVAALAHQSSSPFPSERLYALCDDGALFGMTPPDSKGNRHWEELPQVPPSPIDVIAAHSNNTCSQGGL